MLKRGGGPDGRRFQMTPNYYFTVYSYLMKQKIGGVATLAQKKSHDGNALPETIPTVGEVNSLLDYLGSTTSEITEGPQHTGQQRSPNTQSTTDIASIKKLISRLVPYSKVIPGTEMGIRYEKRNLMALIPSPVVNADGYWRWFITFAPADLFDNRLFEITRKIDNEDFTWEEKYHQVRFITHENYYFKTYPRYID